MTYRLKPADDDDKDDKHRSPEANEPMTKDIMSYQRGITYLKSAGTQGFPRDTHIVQEMLHSANLKPPTTSLTPGIPPVPNVAPEHEIFEAHWNKESD